MPTGDLGRYSKVYRRIWRDAKFRGLTDAAKLLFLRLMTDPDLGSIPGVLACTAAGLAETMGWTTEAFGEAFEQVLAKGMAKVDRRAGLVWLPNAARYNRPGSPNVVVGWRREWPEVPECQLKHEIFESLKGFTDGLGKAFRDAFREALGDPVAVTVAVAVTGEGQNTASAGASAVVSKQPLQATASEESDPAAEKAASGTQAAKARTGGPLVDLWVSLMRSVRGVQAPTVQSADAATAYRWAKGRPDADVKRAVEALVNDSDHFMAKNGWALRWLPSRADGYLATRATLPSRGDVDAPWRERAGAEVKT